MKWLVTIVVLFAAPAARADESARKACADAMNADPDFARSIIKEAERLIRVNVDTLQACKDGAVIKAHQDAADDVATNQRHVLMAYIAMWLVAIGFVVFLWRRHAALKLEIAHLRKDLAAAVRSDGDK